MRIGILDLTRELYRYTTHMDSPVVVCTTIFVAMFRLMAYSDINGDPSSLVHYFYWFLLIFISKFE